MANAIITGGSLGFGHALAHALVGQGWTVIVDARDGARLTRATQALPGAGNAVAVAGDVADAAHRRRLVDAARELGGLDLLVHNASTLGRTPLPALLDYPLDELRRVYAINVVAPLALTQEAAPLLAGGPAPTVVTLSSDAAAEPYPGWGAYGSAKSALDHLAAVLGVEQPQWRVYAFDPGDMRTAMQQAAFPGDDISDRAAPESVVPALLRLLRERPASGRYRASDLMGREAA